MPRPISRRTFVAGATAAALLLPGAALAREAPNDNGTPDRALPFRPSQSLALPGGPGGRFAYYRFNSPGGWPVRFTMDPGRSDKAFLRAVGYKVYGPVPDRVYVEGKFEDDVWKGTTDLSWTSDAGDFLIQVYNYNPSPDVAMTFTLTGENIPPQPGDANGPAGPTVPEPGAYGYTAIPLAGVQSGSLAPNASGSFRYYTFRAGAGTTIGVDMQVEPDDQGVLEVAGFKLYGPSPGKEYLQSEARRGRSPNQTGNLYVTDSGAYVLQVYNYHPDATIEYRVSTRGPADVD